VVGDEPIISASMDPHGCVSQRLLRQTDIMTCYRMAPHEDSPQTRRRAVANLLERLESGKGKPKYKAWVYVPVLLPGEKTSTRIDPGKSLYAKVPGLTDDREGVVDGGIWISYAWADEPRNHGVVVVCGDDKEAVASSADSLARSFWAVRDKFEFVAPTASLDECLRAAFASDKKPYFLSDMGDNPTAGGAGDVTWTLHELLKRPELQKEGGKTFIYASIPGPELVDAAFAAGVGNKVSGYAGAQEDFRYAGPVKIEGVVDAVYESPTNKEVVIRQGAMRIIVSAKRKGYHFEKDFTNLGLDIRNADIVMVKLGYLTEELYDIQADWMMALTKGGVDQDLLELPYKGINRPMYPLDPDMDDPSFEVVFL
jgi:microcystin degradation protein MlrC